MLTIIAIVIAIVAVFVPVWMSMRSRKTIKEQREAAGRVIRKLKVRQQKQIDSLKADVLQEAKNIAEARAEAIFKQKAEGIVSAQVSDAMDREHKLLIRLLDEKVQAAKEVQDKRIESVGVVADNAGNLLSRVAQTVAKLGRAVFHKKSEGAEESGDTPA